MATAACVPCQWNASNMRAISDYLLTTIVLKPKIPQQNDTYNCAAYTLKFALETLSGRCPDRDGWTFTGEDAARLRRAMALRLVHELDIEQNEAIPNLTEDVGGPQALTSPRGESSTGLGMVVLSCRPGESESDGGMTVSHRSLGDNPTHPVPSISTRQATATHQEEEITDRMGPSTTPTGIALEGLSAVEQAMSEAKLTDEGAQMYPSYEVMSLYMAAT